jgi:hypothetical protein
MSFATRADAYAYIRASDKRAVTLSRMTRRMLLIELQCALERQGRIRIFGTSSKDEMVAEITFLDYPDINAARQVYYASLGEQTHNAAGCRENGQPHLGPCIEPELPEPPKLPQPNFYAADGPAYQGPTS